MFESVGWYSTIAYLTTMIVLNEIMSPLFRTLIIQGWGRPGRVRSQAWVTASFLLVLLAYTASIVLMAVLPHSYEPAKAMVAFPALTAIVALLWGALLPNDTMIRRFTVSCIYAFVFF